MCPDISMCENKKCPQKETCYRYKAKPDPYMQSFCKFKYRNGCEYYWPIDGVSNYPKKK